MKSTPREIFTENLSALEIKIKELSKRSSRISLIRILFFTGSLVTLLYFANQREATIVFIIFSLFVILFAILIRHHNKLNFRLRHHQLLKKVNEEELDRLAANFDTFPDGKEFIDENHSYTSDLDIFGANSLFQLMNRSRTNGGKTKFSQWLGEAAPVEKISERQAAVLELKQDSSWQQELQAHALHFQDSDQSIMVFLDWMKEENLFSRKPYYRILGILMPTLNLISLLSYFLLGTSYLLIISSIAVTTAVYAQASRQIGKTFEKSGESVKVLGVYHLLIQMIENRKFSSSFLSQIKSNFNNPEIHASNAIRKLRKIFTALESRSNILYLLVDIFFLLDIFWVLQAENWKKKYAKDATHWFEAIHDLECINSLAAHAFANPEQPFPEIVEEQILEATNLGHPLIPADERVNNNFNLDDAQKIGIVTGSNMSGKSTFLRTIGINLVMAYMGAPVCASALKIGEFSVFSGMRTHDSLSDHVSSFYAELKRLEKLIHLISDEKTTFFLLDEILKGTNSHDRHKGARSLILQLVQNNCKGLVSTHDLELSEIASKDPRIFNLSFNSKLENNEVLFDYKLENGVCHSFNATQLMQKMGINIVE